MEANRENHQRKNFFPTYQEEEVLSVEQLGGMTNQNYLVKTTNKQYIVKFLVKGLKNLSIVK